MKKIILLSILLVTIKSYSEIDLSLNFGQKTKPIFTAQDLLVGAYSAPTIRIPEKRILTSPALIKFPMIKALSVEKPQQSALIENLLVAPPTPQLAQITEPKIVQSEVVLSPLTKISDDEYKLIQGLIFLDIHKKLEVALGIFADVMNHKEFKDQATLHYARTAYALGLNTEYRNQILQLIEGTKDPSLKAEIAKSVADSAQALQPVDLKKVKPLVEEYSVDTSKKESYLYRLGQYYALEGDLKSAENSLAQINSKSAFYPEATLLSASLSYRKGDVNKAIAKLEKALPLVENNKKDIIRNSIVSTLARLYFQKAQYKQSYQTYLKVDRSSSLWLQSVIEQAWAQILSGDNIGAAGNMFSLHTEIFRKVHLPESYIVRSVGYLNMCQYGDALHVLTDLDSRFRTTYEKLVKFQNENKSTGIYYDLVKAWFSNSKLAENNLVPRSFVAELASHPAFTATQKKINAFEEELNRFNKIIQILSATEATLRKNVETVKSITKQLETQAAKSGQGNLQKMMASSSTRINNEKSALRKKADENIKKHSNELIATLGKLLEQEEILAYEVYSGAGEHIRYQVAGGQVDDRKPEALTPEEKKSYKWKFRGEIWDDEIGHYRSSLKNVCPHDEVAQAR